MPLNKKKVLKLAKGFYGRAKNVITVSRNVVERALVNQYIERRLKKRNFRSLWIMQINAAVRQFGMRYGTFMHGCVLSGIYLNRKMLSTLAITEPYSFRAICDQVLTTLKKEPTKLTNTLGGPKVLRKEWPNNPENPSLKKPKYKPRLSMFDGVD